jgi:hypothetical protein
MESTNIFKTCPKCRTSWASRNGFLSDNLIKLNGYQVSLSSLEKGLLLFTHEAFSCNSTMGIYVTEFNDMYTGTRYTESKALTTECPRYCFDEKRLERCDAKCECAFVREIISTIDLFQLSRGLGCGEIKRRIRSRS